MTRAKTKKLNDSKEVYEEKTSLRVLLKNRRCCCVCHLFERAVQIHHIDGNRRRTVEANLAVVCLEHHDQATAGLRKGAFGLGAKLTPDELRLHKSAWESVATAGMNRPRRSLSATKKRQL
jgi:hypothetical protein